MNTRLSFRERQSFLVLAETKPDPLDELGPKPHIFGSNNSPDVTEFTESLGCEETCGMFSGSKTPELLAELVVDPDWEAVPGGANGSNGDAVNKSAGSRSAWCTAGALIRFCDAFFLFVFKDCRFGCRGGTIAGFYACFVLSENVKRML